MKLVDMKAHTNLSSLFQPSSIAIVGASASPEKIGHIVTQNIIAAGYRGMIYPVNPKETTILGLPCFPDLARVPMVPDLVLVAVPAEHVVSVLTQAGQRGTRHAVVFSAGFKEIGEQGAMLETELIAVADRYNMHILGPNCLGFANTHISLNATFSRVPKNKGKVRFIAQSGAIASSIFDWSEQSTVSFAEFVTLGNKAVVTENEVLEYFLENRIERASPQLGESKYQPLGIYLESLSDGRRFIDLCRAYSKKDPIFILKAGKFITSQAAMQLHTGSVAGEDGVFDAALKEAGCIRCEGMEDFFEYTRAFAWEQAPSGKRVVVVSNAGGPAVVTSDSIAQYGLELAELDEATQKKLSECLPKAASTHNPVDVLGDALAQRYSDALEAVLPLSQVDAVIVLVTPQLTTQIAETARVISRLSLRYKKPVVCAFIGGTQVEEAEAILNKNTIASFAYPERAVRILAGMYHWDHHRRKLNQRERELKNNIDTARVPAFIHSERHLRAQAVIHQAIAKQQTALDGFESDAVLHAYGIETPPTRLCQTVNQAESFAQQYGFPVVLKIASSTVLHKTEVGGVVTNIVDSQELARHFNTLRSKTDRVQIQTQVPSGLELLLGGMTDLAFGKVVTISSGGVLANLIADRNIALPPLSRNRITELLAQAKFYPLLAGYRGQRPYNQELLIDCIMQFEYLFSSNDAIAAIEINPLIVTHEKVYAVDGKIVLHVR